MTATNPSNDHEKDGDHNAEPIVVEITPREAACLIDDPDLPRDGAELHLPDLHTRPPFRLSVLPALPEAAIAC